MEKVIINTRSFQGGKDAGNFDHQKFIKTVADPIRKLITNHLEVIDRIVVTTNGEPGNKLAEVVENGKTPTMIALEKNFPDEVIRGIIVPCLCADWGQNPGSATALNVGLEIAVANNAKWLLNWSPEMEIDGYLINEATVLAEQRCLKVVGALRQSWWDKPQWNLPQNTIALWSVPMLAGIGGFAAECNGTGEKIYTPEYGEVPLAGMEDFHAMLRIMKADPENFRWGMIRRPEALVWDTNFEPGSEREKNHLIKVARQYNVMKSYAGKIFPEVPFNTLMDRFFARYHLG